MYVFIYVYTHRQFYIYTYLCVFVYIVYIHIHSCLYYVMISVSCMVNPLSCPGLVSHPRQWSEVLNAAGRSWLKITSLRVMAMEMDL